MELSSSAFAHNGMMPTLFTCQGENISPPLTWTNVPAGAKSLVLLVDDPDAPDPAAPKMTWDHWVVFNIPPSTTSIAQGATPQGIVGKNSWPKNAYGGPCPPIGTHRYFFKLFALDRTLNLDASATKIDVENAMKNSILARAQLIGLYRKH